MDITTLPAEILDIIGQHVYQDGSFQDYVKFRLSFRKAFWLPEVRTQLDFDALARSRYRKDSFRVFKNCYKTCKLAGNQKFAEKVAEYSDTEALEILLNQQQGINFSNLFFHCVDLNLHTAARMLMKDARVDPSAFDQKAIKTSCLRDHQEMTEVLLEDDRIDPNAAIQYAASENIEKLLKRCPRLASVNRKAVRVIGGVRGAKRTLKKKRKTFRFLIS